MNNSNSYSNHVSNGHIQLPPAAGGSVADLLSSQVWIYDLQLPRENDVWKNKQICSVFIRAFSGKQNGSPVSANNHKLGFSETSSGVLETQQGLEKMHKWIPEPTVRCLNVLWPPYWSKWWLMITAVWNFPYQALRPDCGSVWIWSVGLGLG